MHTYVRYLDGRLVVSWLSPESNGNRLLTRRERLLWFLFQRVPKL